MGAGGAKPVRVLNPARILIGLIAVFSLVTLLLSLSIGPDTSLFPRTNVFHRLRMRLMPEVTVFEYPLVQTAAGIMEPYLYMKGYTDKFGAYRIIKVTKDKILHVWQKPGEAMDWNHIEEGRYYSDIVHAVVAAGVAFERSQGYAGMYVEVGAGMGVLALGVQHFFSELLLFEENKPECERLAANLAWNPTASTKSGIVCGSIVPPANGAVITTDLPITEAGKLLSSVASRAAVIVIRARQQTWAELLPVWNALKTLWSPPALVIMFPDMPLPQQENTNVVEQQRVLLRRLASMYSAMTCNNVRIDLRNGGVDSIRNLCLTVFFSVSPLDIQGVLPRLYSQLSALHNSFHLLDETAVHVAPSTPHFPPGDANITAPRPLLTSYIIDRRLQISAAMAEHHMTTVVVDIQHSVEQRLYETGTLGLQAESILPPVGPHRGWTKLKMKTPIEGSVYDGAPHGPWWWDVVDGAWEPSTFNVIESVIKEKPGVVLDIGMWIAPISLFAAQFATRVVSFEADPFALYLGAANIALNPHLSEKITIVPRCVSSAEGVVRMAGAGGSVSRVLEDTVSPESYIVSCLSLAQAVQILQIDTSDISLIKIDVEGSEVNIFPNIVDWLQMIGLPTVWLSLHPPLWVGGGNGTKAMQLLDAIQRYPHLYSEDMVQITTADIDLSTYSTVLLAGKPVEIKLEKGMRVQCSHPYVPGDKLLVYKFQDPPMSFRLATGDERCLRTATKRTPMRHLTSILKDSGLGTVADIGAGVGTVSLLASAFGFRVAASEVDPYMVMLFHRNMQLNPELASRIQLHHRSMSQGDGGAHFASSDASGAALLRDWIGGVYDRTGIIFDKFWQAPCMAVYKFLSNYTDIKVIYVDTNGMEMYLYAPVISYGVRNKYPPIVLRLYPQYWPKRDRLRVMMSMLSYFQNYNVVITDLGSASRENLASPEFFFGVNYVVLKHE